MYTSADKKVLLKRAFRYLIFSAILLMFHAIYSLFAHGVDSIFMKFAFVIPLVLGSLLSLLLLLGGERDIESAIRQMSISTLVVGSLLQGVMEIAGNTSSLVSVFFITGIVLFFGWLIFVIIRLIQTNA